MRYIDEFRDPRLAKSLIADIVRHVTRPWVLMEICGGQTHTLVRYGFDELLPRYIELVHGPGCPVCVTPLDSVDKAIAIASRPDVIFVSYGDMLRVPGSKSDLFQVKAAGGDVRVVYSPCEAVKIAEANPDRQIVFFGVGFETTAPAHALTVLQAHRLGLLNFSLLASHVLVPPAIETLLQSPRNRVQGFIAPGHVCTIVGYKEYEQLAARHHVPIVVGGFEPTDLLEAIRELILQLETGRAEVVNQYARSVSRAGNLAAQQAIELVFERCDRRWRGIGFIPKSGMRIRAEFAQYDAERVFGIEESGAEEASECIAADVLMGLKKPMDCPAFGSVCVPESPLGAPMVSSEGACAAYYRYRRHETQASGEVH